MKKALLSIILALTWFGSRGQALIAGRVYNDLNGGATIENSASPYRLPKEPLVAVLVRPTVDTIIAVSSVTAGTGAFTFGTRAPGNYYVMVITPSSTLAPGSAAPELVLETGWVRTGEAVSGTTSETTVNGRTNDFALVGSTPVNGILFGIQQRPFADRKMNVVLDRTATTASTLSVNTVSAFTKGGSSILSGTDYSGGTISNYTVNVLPHFGTLYLGAIPVTTLSQVDTLTAAQFATLAYMPGAAAVSQEQDQDHFTYYVTDNGGAKSGNAAYVIPFALTDSDLDLVADRNDWDDDNDGLLDTTECKLLDFMTALTDYMSGGFDFLRPYDLGLDSMHRVGINISEDISANFGKPAGSVIINITNANTHPTRNEWYVNDATGPTQWAISGTLGSLVVLTHGAHYFSYDTRTITLLNGTTKRYVGAQAQSDPAQPNWFDDEDGYSWWLTNNNPLTSPISEGNLSMALTDPEPKYFEMASTANNRNEWATYFVEMKLECDDDDDGIPNRIDLDSDNDGCPDAIEGGGNVVVADLVDVTGSGTVGFGSSSDVVNICGTPSCVDINGVPSFATSAGQPVGTALNPAQQSIICVASIVAVDDDYSSAPSNGAIGNPAVGNILTSDSLNNVVNVDFDSVAISIVTAATPNTVGANVPSINPITGTISIPENTPSGFYNITYSICYTEVANICDTAVVTVLVANPIVAIDNDYGMVNPGTTGITTPSVLGNDSLGGVVVNPANVTVATTGVMPAGFTLNADGTVTIAAGTPPGNYSFDYTICEIGANPANCSTATVTLTIPSIVAINDDYTATPANGIAGNSSVGNILTNDSLNDVVNVDVDSVAITVVTPATPNVTGANTPSINPLTGVVSVPANTPSGSYDITYATCYTEVANVCDTAVVTVLVANPIVAIDNDYGMVNPGATGITTASVLGNDSLGGVVVNPANVTVATTGVVPAGFTLNADGTVTIAAGTPPGNYSFDYTICEIGANPPTNCSTATVTLTIPSIVAMDDDYTATPANGIAGNPSVGNILTNDSLNDVVNVDIDSVAITVVTPATPNVSGANTPSINPATGVVSVPANTPSGSYDITYAICYTEVANVCDTAVVTVLVTNPIVAIDNDYGTITPPTVDVIYPSVLANDSLGGVVLDPTDVTITAVGTLPAGFTLNPDGTVTVAAGTPIGSYSFDYTICEIGANPSSCSTATATLIIDEPTPVTMLYFNARSVEETVLLEWATANEQNNKGFDVQRSADSRSWMSIGFVNSSALNGNSTERIDYGYKDLQPLNGINYYRLMQTDIDGKYEYSVVRQVSFTANSNIAIHPNPATEYVIVSGLTGNETIMVYDAVGKVVRTVNTTSSSEKISLDGLPGGAYHISIISETGKVVSKKVIKL